MREHGNVGSCLCLRVLNPKKEEWAPAPLPGLPEVCPSPLPAQRAVGVNPRRSIETPFKQWVGEKAAGGKGGGGGNRSMETITFAAKEKKKAKRKPGRGGSNYL